VKRYKWKILLGGKWGYVLKELLVQEDLSNIENHNKKNILINTKQK